MEVHGLFDHGKKVKSVRCQSAGSKKEVSRLTEEEKESQTNVRAVSTEKKRGLDKDARPGRNEKGKRECARTGKVDLEIKCFTTGLTAQRGRKPGGGWVWVPDTKVAGSLSPRD